MAANQAEIACNVTSIRPDVECFGFGILLATGHSVASTIFYISILLTRKT